MKYLKELLDIINANDENRLVIFVGSGVSANSQIPTWGDLIKDMASEINWPKSKSVNQSDYLNIAEYFYLADESESHRQYYNYIRDRIGGEFKANIIDDIILKILPHHIITTNYDKLIESSNEINSTVYSVIRKDDDLLTNNSEHYIIKMHGDIDDTRTIVLKESDYLNYEYTHTLISTFIKSLLIDHTFLFVGYSLNDYNLKLIISWINYFCEIHGVKNRPNNYIVQNKPIYKYEEKKLKESNIIVINSKEAAKDLSYTCNLSSSIGQNLYSFLYSIYDKKAVESYDLQGLLENGYFPLLSYNKISIRDLLSINNLRERGKAEYRLFTLITDKEYYNKLVNYVENSETIKTAFMKAGINNLYFKDPESYNANEYKLPNRDLLYDNKLFGLYLNNDYTALFNCLDTAKDKYEKIYYYNLLDKRASIDLLFKECENGFDKNDVVSLLLYKVRKYVTHFRFSYDSKDTEELRKTFDAVDYKYRNASNYLKDIILDSEKYSHLMQTYLNKLMYIYDANNHDAHLYDVHTDLYKIQAYAYDYYEFFKFNFIPLDYYSNPKQFFSYYVEAMLLTYSPKSYFENSTNFFGFGVGNNFEPYVLNDYDLDIMVKYTNMKELKRLISKYHVDEIKVRDSINISKKFINLLNSYEILNYNVFCEQVEIFSLLLSRINMEKEIKSSISNAFLKYFFSIIDKKHMRTFDDLLPSLRLFVDYIFENRHKTKLVYYLIGTNSFLNIKVEFNTGHYRSIVSKICKIYSKKNRTFFANYINSISFNKDYINSIFLFREILSKHQQSDLFENKIELLSIEHVFYLLVDKVLKYNNSIENFVIKALNDGKKAHNSLGAMKVSPDPLETPLMFATLLCILPGFMDVEKIKEFSECSDYIEFMLHPNSFDYSKVDIDHYMWNNLIFSKKYSKFFVEHKEALLTDELKLKFKKDVTSVNQEKIVYGLLLSDNELRDF